MKNVVSSPSILQKFATAALVVMLVCLAGCGSSVKLSEPAKVEEAKTQSAGTAAPVASAPSVAASAAAAQPQRTDQRQVAAVQAQPQESATQPPANLARILYFDYDSFEIKPEAQGVLEGHARFLKANSSRRVGLEGHTDERGGREYNLALGQKRAEAVARAMRVLGVPDAQMEAVSFGKEKPAAAGSDEASWAKNRRVELFYK